jgi:hypothetical protein
MKYFALLSLLLALACQPSTVAPDRELPSPGAIHNECLAEVHAALDERGGPERVSPADERMVLLSVGNRLLERYGEDPLTEEDIDEALEWGREVARMDDPWELLRPLMSASDWKWLNHYLDTATPLTARSVYEEFCDSHGAPEVSSALWVCLDITISSAEYWVEYHKQEEPPVVKDGLDGPQEIPRWMRNLIRFTVSTAVDGITGTLGSGGVVTGFIIGMACSYAAEDLIFGNGYGG